MSRCSKSASRAKAATVDYEAQITLNRHIKLDLISLVSLQTKADKVMSDLNSNPVADSLKRVETDTRDLSLSRKDSLAEQLLGVTLAAKGAGRNFQTLSSQVRDMRDQIVTISQYILREVEVGNQPFGSLSDGPNRLAPTFFRSSTPDLLQDANASGFELNVLQAKLSVPQSMVLQLEESYTQREVRHKARTVRDSDNNLKLIAEARANIERALIQTKGELSLIHQVFNDLHIIHDQLSSTAPEVDGL
ncbi:hypothetical protein B0J17DRAFT_730364 [Rhizoctonia solani]|nr:hypothetical protein B0J17DRAFT_730364 [Rhizoctonia solani]